MKHIKDPGQKHLFDPFERLFSPLAAKTIQNGWQGLFREIILELMPHMMVTRVRVIRFSYLRLVQRRMK